MMNLILDVGFRSQTQIKVTSQLSKVYIMTLAFMKNLTLAPFLPTKRNLKRIVAFRKKGKN